MSVEIKVRESITHTLGKKARISNSVVTMGVLGALVKAQTERRMLVEKATPETNTPWPEWSPGYAKTRIPGVHSLLIDSTDLVKSFKVQAAKGEVKVFTKIPYAAIHQEGLFNIKKRRFMGFGKVHRSEILKTIEERIKSVSGS